MGGATLDVLWTNANPSSAMADTKWTISNLSDYQLLIIKTRTYVDNNQRAIFTIPTTDHGTIMTMSTAFSFGGENFIGMRDVAVDNGNVIHFSEGRAVLERGTAHENITQYSGWIVPEKIWGLKITN